MSNIDQIPSLPSKRRTLSREITVALLIKLVLLSGLWFLVFRDGDGNSKAKPDIAAVFGSQPAGNAHSSINPQETSHAVR